MLKSHRHLFVLSVLMLIGVWLRSCAIHENVWLDELHTAWAVSADGEELVQRARLGNNTSAYFRVVKTATGLFGLHEWSLRFPSVLAGCSLIPLSYVLCRRWKLSIAASLCAATLVTLDRNLIHYSVEARTYVLVQALAIARLWCFGEILEGTSKRSSWMLWTLLGMGIVYLHCTAALVFLGEWVALLLIGCVWRPSHRVTRWRPIFISYVVVGLSLTPTWGLLQEVAARRQNWADFVAKPSSIIDVTAIFPFYFYVGMPCLLLVFKCFLGRGSQQLSESNSVRPPLLERTLLVCCWVLTPVLASWLLTTLDVARLFFPRYLVAAYVVLPILTGCLIEPIGRRSGTRRFEMTLLLLGAVLLISPARNMGYGWGALLHSPENWRPAIAAIKKKSVDIPVILYSGLIEADAWCNSNVKAEREFCEFPMRGLYPLSDDQAVIPLPRNDIHVPDRNHKLDNAKQVWLIVRGPITLANRVQSEVMTVLGDHWEVVETQRFGWVRLVLIVRKT